MDSRAGADAPADARVVGGRYRLLSPLGSGGMGTVWRAEDSVLGRHVAVKEVVFPHGLSDADRATLRERTRREARAAARLDHPSAVTVYDVVEQDGQPWLVLELVEARTLAQVVRGDGPLTPQRTAQVGLAVLGALEAAHRQGIVHRDVKPSNVLLGEPPTGGRVVLTDFGIATSAGDPSITSTGMLLGSPSYIAPERARGAAPAPPSDLWSLGATLFTAVEGRPPYDKGEPMPTLTAVVTDDREPYLAAGPLVPVLDGLLAPDPERRLDSGTARRMLQEVASGPAVVATPAPQPAPEAEQRAERTTALPLPSAAPVAEPQPVAAPRVQVPEPVVAPPAPPRSVPRTLPSADDAPARRGRTGLVAAAAAGLLVLGGAGYGVAQLGDPGSTGDPQAATSPPAAGDGTTEGGGGARTSSAPSAAAPSSSDEGDEGDDAPTDSGSAATAGVPKGWRTYTGGPGWTAAVPAGWVAGTYGGFPQYRDAATGRTLRVSTGPGTDRAVADRERQEADFRTKHPDYQRIRLEQADYRGYPAADWEFTYSAGGARLHVINRVFNVNGRGHSLFFQTRASDWPQARADFEQIVASFRPAVG